MEKRKLYIGSDGLHYCEVCNTPVEKKLPNEFLGPDYKVTIKCKCQREKQEQEERQRKEREHKELVRRNKGICFHERRMWEWTFENDNGSNSAMDTAKKFVENWDEIVKKKCGLLLWGGVGSGKTYVAACIANALLEQEKTVLMTDFATISNISVFDAENYVAALSRYDLLIVDDLGAERTSEFPMQNVFNVINRRWESGKPLIVQVNEFSLRRRKDRS